MFRQGIKTHPHGNGDPLTDGNGLGVAERRQEFEQPQGGFGHGTADELLVFLITQPQAEDRTTL